MERLLILYLFRYNNYTCLEKFTFQIILKIQSV
jgi:hypothetical protein